MDGKTAGEVSYSPKRWPEGGGPNFEIITWLLARQTRVKREIQRCPGPVG